MPTASQSICVIGDVTLDCNIARLPALKTESVLWNDQDRASVTWERGGAALLADVIRAVLAHSPVAGQTPWTVCGPKTPEEMQINDHVPFPRCYSVWTPHLVVYGEKDPKKAKEQVWRVDRFLGLSKTASSMELENACPLPDILVINDAQLGFDQKPFPYPEWFTGKKTPRWIVWKTSRLNLASPLWTDFLSKHSDRLIVLCTADGLRKGDAQISRGISWERTVQDLLWDLNFKKFGTRMQAGTSTASCARVVVSFGAAGTLILNPQADSGKKEGRARLVFDPQAVEDSWEAQRPGHVMGYFSCMTAAIVRCLVENLETPDLVAAVHAGVHAYRRLHTDGYGKAGDKLPDRMAFPHAVIAQAVADRWLNAKDCADCQTCKADTMACVPVPMPVACSSHDAGEWSILKSKADLATLAQHIVLGGSEGPLKGVPTAKFGKFFETADRREIENYRSVRNLLAEFINTKGSKPVSMAVFGPPGSGKSFGVKALAEELAQNMNVPIEIRTFNLSQFQTQSSEDLNNALHQVRDIGLSGKLPLIFWDEFDTNNLGWLRRFLEPMQDGTFLEGQVTHPIGKAIFVFAGGTCKSLADFNKGFGDPMFIAAKGPDFVSRLRGYLDILGPNPVGSKQEDPAFIVRRAMLLRSLIERNCPALFTGKKLSIDENVLNALLYVGQYKHGARSMESLVLSSSLSGKLRYDRSSLPLAHQLDVHVNGFEFLTLVSEFEEPKFFDFARAIHQNYYDKLTQRGYHYAEKANDEEKTSASLKPFDDLPENIKADNLDAAKKMPDKVATVGYAIAPYTIGKGVDGFSKEELDLLAEKEHDRWLRGKIANGWVYGEPRDDATKRHPAMLPWRALTESERAALYPEKPEAVGLTALPDNEKQKDRDQFEGLPAMLMKYGYAVTKRSS